MARWIRKPGGVTHLESLLDGPDHDHAPKRRALLTVSSYSIAALFGDSFGTSGSFPLRRL